MRNLQIIQTGFRRGSKPLVQQAVWGVYDSEGKESLLRGVTRSRAMKFIREKVKKNGGEIIYPKYNPSVDPSHPDKELKMIGLVKDKERDNGIVRLGDVLPGVVDDLLEINRKAQEKKAAVMPVKNIGRMIKCNG